MHPNPQNITKSMPLQSFFVFSNAIEMLINYIYKLNICVNKQYTIFITSPLHMPIKCVQFITQAVVVVNIFQ